MIACPNLRNPEVARDFEELKNATSEKAAYYIWSHNNGNSIDKAPNGAQSRLFAQLLSQYNGDRKKAIRAKARIYSKSFINYFGDWINPENVDDTIPEAEPVMMKDPSGSGEYIKAFPFLISERQRMLNNLDENGEPNFLELHLFKHSLKQKIGLTVLDSFFESGAYQSDIDAIREIAERDGDKLSIEDAIKIYNSILKYTAEHGYVPTIQINNGYIIDAPMYPGDIHSQLNEIIKNAFGEDAFVSDE